MMTTNMKIYFLEENEEEVGKDFRDNTESQFEQDLYKKYFSSQLESDDEFTLQQRIEWWMTFVDRGGPIPNNIYDHSSGELLFHLA